MNHYPPGPNDRLLGLTTSLRFRARPLEFATEMAARYGDIAYFRMGPYRTYVLNQPQWIHEVLVGTEKHCRKLPRPINAIRGIDGNGIVLSEGDFWRQQRRLLQPAFYPARLRSYAQTVIDYTERMLDRWGDRGTVDAADEMTHLACAIIVQALFGFDLSAQADELGRALAVLSETYMHEMWEIIYTPSWLPTAAHRRKWRAIRVLDRVINDILQARLRDDRGQDDVLTTLLAAAGPATPAERRLTMRQVRDEVMNLFNAGHDATAAQMAWTWYVIARHPEVEQRLVAEAEQVLGDRPATPDDLPHLKYTEMVVSESQRLWPALWAIFPRQNVVEVQLGPWRIPRKSWLYIFPFATHRDPRYFPDPLRFDPERFSPERIGSIPAHAYFPFGGGTHICMGNTLAMNEMKLIVACTLRRYRLRLADPQAPIDAVPHIAIRPRGGLRMTLAPRHARAPEPAGRGR